MTTYIKCPNCQKQTTWKDNKWRPFCSERCKTIDLGDWASERHFIAGDELLQEIDEETLTANLHQYEKGN